MGRELVERGLALSVERPKGATVADAVLFLCIRNRRIDEVFVCDRRFDQEGLARAP